MSTIVRYQASTPNAKYLGSNLRGFTDSLNAAVINPILEKYKVKEIIPGEWMDAQLQLDILREIEAEFSYMDLVAVGMKSGEFVPLPPEIDSIEKYLAASPQIAQSVVQNVAPEEKVEIERLSANHYRMILNIPAPPFVMYGYLYGVLRRLRKEDDKLVILTVEEGTPYIFDFRW